MSFDAGSVVGKIRLDKTDFDRSVAQVQGSVAALGQSMTNTGQQIFQVSRQISNVGRNLAYLGGGIVAPLILAFKSAEKYSIPVRQEMERLNNVTIKMRVSIAESLVPVMHKLSNVLADLLKRWDDLNPAMRASILQTAFVTAEWILLGGIALSVAAKIGQLIGKLWIFAGVIVTLISHMAKLIPLMAIFTTFRLGGLMTDIGLLAANAGIAYPIIVAIIAAFAGWKLGQLIADVSGLGAATGSLNEVLNYLEWVGLHVASGLTMAAQAVIALHNSTLKLTDPLGAWSKSMQKTNENMIRELFKTLDTVNAKIKNIESGNNGALAGMADNLKEKISSIKDIFAGFSGLGQKDFVIPDKIFEASKTFAEGWHDALQQANFDLHNWGAMAESIVQQTTQQMQSMFSNLFMGFLQGQLRSAQDFFVAWGQFVLKIISDVIAQIITAKIVSSFLGIFSGASSIAGAGVASVAPPNYYLGHDAGIESVPATGIYKLHKDEKVVPAYDANKSSDQPIIIYNLVTPEAIAQAMSGKEGKGVIVNTIDANSSRGGSIRKMIKRS